MTKNRLRRVAARVKRIFVYTPVDPVRQWQGRAMEPGSHSVMWRNAVYNSQAQLDQVSAILRSLPARREAVLDLGCGTGRLTGLLGSHFSRYVGVDLDEMVTEARRRNPDVKAEFVGSSIQEYKFLPDSFDLVLSMGCLSSACRADELPNIGDSIVAALRPGGRFICIDPFHRLPVLTRTCRISPREAVEVFTGLGVQLVEWSGLHFVPMRLLLARPVWSRFPRLTVAGYKAGKALGWIAPRLLADYSVIVLQKP